MIWYVSCNCLLLSRYGSQVTVNKYMSHRFQTCIVLRFSYLCALKKAFSSNPYPHNFVPMKINVCFVPFSFCSTLLYFILAFKLYKFVFIFYLYRLLIYGRHGIFLLVAIDTSCVFCRLISPRTHEVWWDIGRCCIIWTCKIKDR